MREKSKCIVGHTYADKYHTQSLIYLFFYFSNIKKYNKQKKGKVKKLFRAYIKLFFFTHFLLTNDMTIIWNFFIETNDGLDICMAVLSYYLKNVIKYEFINTYYYLDLAMMFAEVKLHLSLLFLSARQFYREVGTCASGSQADGSS